MKPRHECLESHIVAIIGSKSLSYTHATKGLQVLLREELNFLLLATCIYHLLHFTWQVYYDSFHIMTSICTPPFNCTCPLLLRILALTIADLFGQAELVGIWASVFRTNCTILEWLKLPGSLHYHPNRRTSLKLTIHWHCLIPSQCWVI